MAQHKEHKIMYMVLNQWVALLLSQTDNLVILLGKYAEFNR